MIDKNKLFKLREQGLTYEKLGQIFNVSRQRIGQIITGYKGSSATELRRAKKRQFYQKLLDKNIILDTRGMGGYSGREFTRESVRRRDKYTCQLCQKKWIAGQRRFDVHHLNGLCGKKSRSYDKVSDANGLITLCHKCHYNYDSHTYQLRKKY